ncbi:MAG: alpha/beta hydrolase, partial [Alphaproteobacteria bacterium]|nr:alpha/beta hydrolase [Alphaproteobacteria bacterium]
MATLVGSVVVAYAMVVAVAFAMQRTLIYFPPAEPPIPVAPFDEVRLRTEDGLDLLAWYAPPRDAAAPVLLYFHGNAESIESGPPKLAPFLAEGFGALLVEYRGYAGNPGKPSESGLYLDASAGMAWLMANGVASERVIPYGASLGSGIAVEVAASHPIRAVVLEAPFTSLAEVGARSYPYLPARLLTRDRYDSLAKMSGIEAPLFVLHGEADRLVPAEMGRALLAAAAGPTQGHFVAGLGHGEMLS